MLTETQGHEVSQGNSLPEPAVAEDDQTECVVESSPCQDNAFVTAVYVTGHRCFWLLTKQALASIKTSASQLKAAVAKPEVSQRLSALKTWGLADLFVPPTPKSFLPTGNQTEWDQLLEGNRRDRASVKRLNDAIANIDTVFEDKVTAVPNDADYYINLRHLRNEQRRAGQEKRQERSDLLDVIGQRNDQLETLNERGTEAAKSVGFEVSGHQLFSPGQAELQTLLDDYEIQRHAFEEDSLPDASQTKTFLTVCRLNRELIADEWQRPQPDVGQIEQYLTELNRLEGSLRPYAETVVALANAGVATPEYALANDDHIEQGIEELASYRQLDFRIKRVTRNLEDAAAQWSDVLADQGPVPSPALMTYRKEIEACEEKQAALHCKAQSNAEKLKLPRLFIWNPALYEKRPFKALVKPGMPLREFSRPGSEALVEHFSILALGGASKHYKQHPLPDHPDYQDQPAKVIAAALKSAQRPGSDTQLDTLFTDLGCKKLTLQNSWFDPNGLFVPDAFFKALKDDIRDLESASARKAWGEQLQSLLFKADAGRYILPFDDSYIAQFTRLALSGIPEGLANVLKFHSDDTGPQNPSSNTLDKNISLGTPDNKIKASFTLSSASVGTKLTFSQGQLDLLNLKLPEPSKATPITLDYRTGNGQESGINMGRFYCAINAKCWGFAGARIALSRTVAIDAIRGEGLKVLGVDGESRNRTVQGGELDAFAGGQAGLLAMGELFWSVPDNLRERENWRHVTEKLPEWLSLGLLKGELVGAAGAGVKGDVTVGLHNGRLVVHVKGRAAVGLGGGLSLGFEIAFGAIPFWIRLLQQTLRDNGYRHIDWIEPDAFKYMGWLSHLFLTTALDISFLAARGYDFVQTAFRALNQSDRAGMVALHITQAIDRYDSRQKGSAGAGSLAYEEYAAWFDGLQPEAVGPLLNHLIAEPQPIKQGSRVRFDKAQVLVMQQRALLQCVVWIKEADFFKPESYRQVTPNAIQRQFTEALVRMNIQGATPAVEETKGLARSNLRRLDAFMKRGPNDRPQDYRTYREYRNALAVHVSEQI